MKIIYLILGIIVFSYSALALEGFGIDDPSIPRITRDDTLTRQQANTLYCMVNAACNLALITVDNLVVGNLTIINGNITWVNVTVINYTVIGEMNVEGGIVADNFSLSNGLLLLPDSNASTACGVGRYLDGNGLCIHFNDSVKRLFAEEQVVHNATNISTETGTLTGGNLSSVQILGDGETYNVTEVTGTPGFRININFSNVTNFNVVALRGKYTGGAGHTLALELFRVGTQTWEERAEITDQMDFGVTTFDVFIGSNFIDTNNIVQFRINHDDTGNINHKYELDAVFIGQVTGLVSGGDLADLTGRDEACELLPDVFCKDGSKNMTGQLNGTSAVFTNLNVINTITSGTYNGLSIIQGSDWIYLSGDGSIESGFDISIPRYAGRHFYYGYGGGAENHYFGNAGELTITSNGDLITNKYCFQDATCISSWDEVNITQTDYDNSSIIRSHNTTWVQETINGSPLNLSDTTITNLNVTESFYSNNWTCPDGTCEIDSTLAVDHIAERTSGHDIEFDNEIVIDNVKIGGASVISTAALLALGDGNIIIVSNSFDFGTNTITDGVMTGNWDFTAGNLTTTGDVSCTDVNVDGDVTARVIKTSTADDVFSDFSKGRIFGNFPTVKIRQESTGGSQVPLQLKQDDTSEGYIDFVGTLGGAVGADNDESIIIEVNGVKKRIKLYDLT